MSEIFGAPERFAVEYELLSPETLLEVLGEPALSDAERAYWLFGRIRFWAGGTAIGDYEPSAALTVALASFEPQLLANRGKRQDPRFMTGAAELVFHRINSAIYEDDERNKEQIAQDLDFARFYGIPAGFDAFDGWMAFLIEDGGRGRYLWSKRDRVIREVVLDSGEFDDALEAFLSDLEGRTGQTRTRVKRDDTD